MAFNKYPSIENSYRDKFIHAVQCHENFPGMKWQITEKIHGANFSFVVDKKTNEVRVGKRSGLTDGGFYGCQAVLDLYRDSILELASDSVFDGADLVQVFGELFGNGVQRGVYYSDEKDFAAFDIRWDAEESGGFLGTTPVQSLCDRYGIPHVPVLEEFCSFDVAMAYSGKFVSLVSTEAVPENYAEGVVIKPMRPMFLHSGSRVILKTKSDKFKEKTAKKQKPVPEFTDEMNEIMTAMVGLLNENRLRNVISKIGVVTQKDFGRILGDLCIDVIEEWAKDNDWGVMDKKDRKLVTKALNREAGALIRRNFVNIIDGEF